MKTPKILVLCHGNINRSPACAAILQTYGFKCRSRGFREGNVGMRATAKIRRAMQRRGIDLETHRAQKITDDDVVWSNLIIYMDGGNEKRLKNLYPEAMKKSVCLAEYLNPVGKRIPDPNYFAKDSKEFIKAVNILTVASKRLAESLQSGLIDKQAELSL